MTYITGVGSVMESFSSLRGRVKILREDFSRGLFSKGGNGCDSHLEMQELGLEKGNMSKQKWVSR